MPSGIPEVPCYEGVFRRWLWALEFHHRLLRVLTIRENKSPSRADDSAGELGSSRQQQQLPGGLPPFKIPVRLLHLRQRIHMFDPQLELAVANHAEDRRGTL